jgi:hypothetical protein
MIETTASDWFTITGRGQVAVVDTRTFLGQIVSTGDTIRIDGKLYKVNGVERSRILTSPPTDSPHVGLQVREV